MSAGLDRLIHEPARLQLVAQLAVIEEADFVYLSHQTGLTAGNLSSHMRRLAEAGYVEVRKAIVEDRPQTSYRLTPAGRKAYDIYRVAMHSLLAAER